MPALKLFPAVDISQGRAVRPVSGRLTHRSENVDPVEAGLSWCRAGTRWLHLVDLDLAFGRGTNTRVLRDVIEQVRRDSHDSVRIQVSGGIKDERSLELALSLNPDRINVTSAALQDPTWLEKTLETHKDRLALGLDARNSTVVARGTDWTGDSVRNTVRWLDSAGAHRYIVTDVSRDGTLAGPGLRLLDEVLSLTERPVVASGGVASLNDIRVLHSMADQGLEGLVLGKALYSGKFTFEEALKVAEDGTS